MITVNNPTPTPQPTPEVSFSASPASGAAPLAVVFTASGISTANGVISMDYGDGSLVQTGYCLGGTCGSATYYHTYSAGGTYTAKLLQSSQTLATTVVTVTGSSQTAVSVHVSPSSVQQGSAPLSTGGTLHITWSSTNAPVGAGVAMWIVKSDGTTLGSIYPGTRATSGSYDWAVPGPQCDSTGLNCMYQTDSDSAYYTSPGTYYILAKLYTPSNACTGLCIIANPVQPTYIATAKSATFTITGNTVSVATPSVGPMSGYNTAQCVAPTAPACASGYHQCTGSGCSYIGEIVPAPYYCLTSENPVVIMNLPTGSSWPMNNCYNAPPQSSLGLVSSSVDYLGCSLAASCVPN